MLQAPNPTERVHPLELWARAIEADPNFNVRAACSCNMAVALKVGLLAKRPSFKDITAQHDTWCPCRQCCDWPALAAKVGVELATLERFWSGENGARAATCAATMRGLIPREKVVVPGARYMPEGFA